MRRRDLSKVLVASTVGAALLPVRPQESAHAAAGSAERVAGPEDIRRLGGLPDGHTDNAEPISRARSMSGSSYFTRGTWRVGADLSLDKAYAPIFEGLAVWKPDAGRKIAIAGQITSAGNQQIFDLSNERAAVTISNQVVNAAWFGTVPDGEIATAKGTDNRVTLQRAIDAVATAGGGALYLPPGVYVVSEQVIVPDGVTMYGAGKWATILVAPAAFNNAGGLIRITGRNGYPTCLHGISVLGQQNGAGGVGIYSAKNGVFIRDIWCAAFTSSAGIVIDATDNFLADFVLEFNRCGVQVNQTHVTLANGKTYRNSAAGIIVANNSSPEEGRVTIDTVRSAEDAEHFVVVSRGKRVTVSNCDVSSGIGGRYRVAAYHADAASDVIFNACSGTAGPATKRVADAAFTAGVLVSPGSQKITVNGCHMTGFDDGFRAEEASAVKVNGGDYSGNVRRGVYFAAGDRMICQGVDASGNGGAESGIHSDNTAPAGQHLIVGNIASGQKFGITARVGGKTSVTNLVGNLTAGNRSGGIHKTGTVANINEVGNL